MLFVVNLPEDAQGALKELKKMYRYPILSAVVFDPKKRHQAALAKKDSVDILIPADFSSPSKVTKALMPYQHRFLAVTCRGEYNIGLFRALIPHVPYLRTPTATSLEWATNKLEMRKRFFAYDKTMSPKFAIVEDAGKASIVKIKKRVKFPMVVKPTGLAASLLVTLCYHQDELERALRNAFRKVRKLYREQGAPTEPKILVEEFMEGDMYSIDSYVSTRGTVYHCPIVHIKTGQAVGYEDFFGYMRMTPTKLSKASILKAQDIATKTVHALGLRSSTAHTELMRTEDGWRVIESGPRIGGNRVLMYELSYGFNHALNDILIRIPKKPVISNRARGYSSVLEFFAKKEGRITKIKGRKKAELLGSFHSLTQKKKVGDRAKFASRGGKAILSVCLFNKDRSELLADIRRLEKMVVIETRKGVA